MKASSGPSTAPREWTIKAANVFATTIDGPKLKLGEEVKLVERASLDRVVEERDRLAWLLATVRCSGNWYADPKHKVVRSVCLHDGTAKGQTVEGCGATTNEAAQDLKQKLLARAALQSGEGERHEE